MMGEELDKKQEEVFDKIYNLLIGQLEVWITLEDSSEIGRVIEVVCCDDELEYREEGCEEFEEFLDEEELYYFLKQNYRIVKFKDLFTGKEDDIDYYYCFLKLLEMHLEGKIFLDIFDWGWIDNKSSIRLFIRADVYLPLR